MTVVAKFIATSFACYVVAFDSLKNYDLRLCAYDLHVSHAGLFPARKFHVCQQ